MVWSLIWLNKSIATINVMFQLIYIYMGNVNKCPQGTDYKSSLKKKIMGKEKKKQLKF